MRLVTFTHSGSTRVGALDDSGITDLTAAGLPSRTIDLLEGGAEAMDRAREATRRAASVLAIEDAHILAPVPRPGKVLAIGLNYRDHAEESGQPIPQRPVVFAKMPTCVTGPGKPVYMPRVSRAVTTSCQMRWMSAPRPARAPTKSG